MIGILSFTESADLQTIDLIGEDFSNTSYDDYNFFVREVYWYRYTDIKYIKIEVESIYNEIAISYYENDSKFKERKQLSHAFSNSTFMWINNPNKNDFYFSINCKLKNNYIYNLKIYRKNNAELLIMLQKKIKF